MDKEKVAEVLRDLVKVAGEKKFINNTLHRDPMVLWSDVSDAMSELASLAGIEAAGEPAPEPEVASEPPPLPPVHEDPPTEGFI